MDRYSRKSILQNRNNHVQTRGPCSYSNLESEEYDSGLDMISNLIIDCFMLVMAPVMIALTFIMDLELFPFFTWTLRILLILVMVLSYFETSTVVGTGIDEEQE